MNEHGNESPHPYRCFRCEDGCVHIICGNVMLTLRPANFLALAETVGDMRRRIQEESELLALRKHSSNSVM